MHGCKSQQQGASFTGLLASLIIIGLAAAFAVKVMPAYLDDYALKKILSSLDEQTGGEAMSVDDLRLSINKGLQTNLVKLGPDEMKIFREGNSVVVNIDYERRLNFLYNIDLILMFKHDWKAKYQ